MTSCDTEVAIIGGGAAGIAAARRLRNALVDCLILEARPRLEGRAWTNNVLRPGFETSGWACSGSQL